MTRPKVSPDQRQRTQQACTSCKRRKQKCNGLCPCNTCEKRSFQCIYDDRVDPGSPASSGPPTKRRRTESNVDLHTPDTGNDSSTSKPTSQTQAASIESPETKRPKPQSIQRTISHDTTKKLNAPYLQPLSSVINHDDDSMESAARSLQQFSVPKNQPSQAQPPPSAFQDGAPTAPTAPDEEAIVYSQTRMLQDPTGRLLYVGDSATLSFLQLIRMMVETVCGPSPFTTDPRRHKIMESQFSLPANARNSLLIPHKTTAIYLADAFFTNTHGLVHIFNRKVFFRSLENTYTDPLSADPNWLCLLNLVFAIGLTMATPAQGTPEAAVIEKLKFDHVDRAEVFYLNAKSLNDPMIGLEDADFWSVQALILMTVFMLAKSKRNTAFALLGMAIRSAYALGLHREETLIIFDTEEQSVRRSVWRTLFVMDRFLSCSLGRPPGISEDECSGDILRSPNQTTGLDDFGFNHAFRRADENFAQTGAYGLEAAVRSCSVIGVILKKIYQQRKVSTKLAQEIADICKQWPKELRPQLHWRQASSATPSQGVAILHVNLFYCHSIVLLTRPFFLFILNDILQQGQNVAQNGTRSRRSYARMEKFSEACVVASGHTVVLVQNAFEAGYLPRRNPFVIYFLFAAALILMSNEFALLHLNVPADQYIRNCITIMTYCAEMDPQASRLLYILSTFRDVIMVQREQRTRQHQPSNHLPPPYNLKSNINPYGTTPQQQNNLTNTSNTSQFGLTLPPVPTNPYSQLPQLTSLTKTPLSHPQPSPSERINLPNISHHHQSPSTSTSPRTTRPLEPSLASPAPPNPLSPHPSGLQTPSLDRQPSFSAIFEISAFGNDRMSVSEDSTGPEENIDFDALWTWGAGTPAVGSPKAGAIANAAADLRS